MLRVGIFKTLKYITEGRDRIFRHELQRYLGSQAGALILSTNDSILGSAVSKTNRDKWLAIGVAAFTGLLRLSEKKPVYSRTLDNVIFTPSQPEGLR